VRNLTYSYFEEPVLQHVDMVLEEHMVHILLGPNGSGKTTLGLAIAGVITPGTGTVRVDGEDPASKQFDRSRVQLAFQFPEEQMFETTVEAEIAFGLKNFGLGAVEARQRSEWALGCVGLPAAMLGRPPDELSYGEMRKVALASVIALRPRYLILDEPLAGLDWRSRQSIIESLEALKREDVTTLVLTHEPDLAAEIGDTVSLLVGGLLESGPTPTDEFFYPAGGKGSDVDFEYLPDTIRVLRGLRRSGVKVPGLPVREADVIDAVFGAHGSDPS
jgi:energy-coupling factor transporter ATP-binding protein EcfA2